MSNSEYIIDYKLVKEVLDNYIKGCAEANSEIMQENFSSSATVFSVDQAEKLSGGSIENLFNALDNDFAPSPNAQSVIANIDIIGTAASARVDTINLSGFNFSDFFHLLKIEGKWKVVSKIFHTHI